MKITTISYKKLFPTAPYENVQYGLEIQIDEGEDPDHAKQLAVLTVNRWHSEEMSKKEITINPEYAHLLSGNKGFPNQFDDIFDKHHPLEVPVIQVDKGNVDPVLRGIREATNMDQLRPYKKAAMNSGLLVEYGVKMKELTQKESI
jgi:hypothetical protein